jgi:hypothetical protein
MVYFWRLVAFVSALSLMATLAHVLVVQGLFHLTQESMTQLTAYLAAALAINNKAREVERDSVKKDLQPLSGARLHWSLRLLGRR